MFNGSRNASPIALPTEKSVTYPRSTQDVVQYSSSVSGSTTLAICSRYLEAFYYDQKPPGVSVVVPNMVLLYCKNPEEKMIDV